MMFGRQQVLSNVHLDVFPNETLALIGESGCGKSVILKLIVGLLKPTDGEVSFEGKTVHRMNERDLTAMRLRVGFLFQGAALFDSLSVFDNVAFGVRAKGGTSEADVLTRVRERLTEVGLPDGVEVKMPAELSGGMRKRVGLARALALNPDVLLYDEPTTGLDPIMTDVINELILLTRNRHPVTGVVVTHEMRTVHKVADRVVMLYPFARLTAAEPQVIYNGSAGELQTTADPRVRQFVLGEARDRLTEIHGWDA
jgi:phospholipid/cholesterol/gamma-HCH transport system ATP-binding protein